MTKTGTHSRRISSTRERNFPSCAHCGRECIVAEVGLFARLNREHPLPGFAEVLNELTALVGRNGMLSVCTGCACIIPLGHGARHSH